MSEESTVREYEDIALLAILDALEADLGRVPAAKELGVNFRTFVNCRDSRRVTPRMRKALKQFINWVPVVGNPVAEADQAYSSIEDPGESLALEVEDLEVEDLEAENRELRETNETQTAHIVDWERRLAALGEQRHKRGVGRWLPWNRHIKKEEVITDRFMDPPKPGVVTLEHRLGEEKAFGRAAPLVAEWREVKRTESTSEEPVEQARAKVRRLQLEYDLLYRHSLNLPPATGPLHYQVRLDESSKRRSDLNEADRELEVLKKQLGRNPEDGD